MSRNQRLALVAAAVAVAAIAFVIASPGGDDDEGDAGGAARTAPAQIGTTGTADERPPESTPEPREPEVERIAIAGGQVEGGAKTITVAKGDPVRIVVSSDAADEIHLHGYDITRNVAPGRPGRFRFEAQLEGVFEMESHVAEDAGREAAIARLVVEP